MKNLRYHFPTCYAYSVKEPIRELNLVGAWMRIEESSLYSSVSLGQTAFFRIPPSVNKSFWMHISTYVYVLVVKECCMISGILIKLFMPLVCLYYCVYMVIITLWSQLITNYSRVYRLLKNVRLSNIFLTKLSITTY